MSAGFTNRLARETSPYLLQHAHNPVDWYPWGEEALSAARAQDKPIFLSIGYSACHWCHVMEKESFEDPATAQVMNERFINIKVDREERPDLDQIYMTAVQLLTQHGGWPMSVWLTPSLKPFHGGTYFPPEPRHGLPSFQQVLRAVSDAWSTRRQDIDASANRIVEHIKVYTTVEKSNRSADHSLVLDGARQMLRLIDPTWGGIGRAPKFPHSVEMRLLFRGYLATGEASFRDAALHSLERMARGGIYDQLGGGFHRYSTDERWLVPHFEKMLYDNALIPLALLEAYQASQREEFRQATLETLDYVLREMTSPNGSFFSTQDADSEGVEGKFFVWSAREILDVLGEKDGQLFCVVYDVTEQGNWEGHAILHRPRSLDELAPILNRTPEELSHALAEMRRTLLEARSRRVAPGRDEKVLASWNGMMLDTMATAGRALDQPRYVEAARRNAEFLLAQMRRPNGRLYRTSKDGRSRLEGYLEDYAAIANGLVSLYEATFESRWIEAALSIVDTMIEQCWDDKDGGFFTTGNDHEELITRAKDPNDNATPSGNSLAAMALARLVKLTGRDDLSKKLQRTFDLFAGQMAKNPFSAAQMLLALDLDQGDTVEIALVGDRSAPEIRSMKRAIDRRLLPNKVLAGGPIDGSPHPVALLSDKTLLEGRPTAYVCRRFTCQRPVTSADELESLLPKGPPA